MTQKAMFGRHVEPLRETFMFVICENDEVMPTIFKKLGDPGPRAAGGDAHGRQFSVEPACGNRNARSAGTLVPAGEGLLDVLYFRAAGCGRFVFSPYLQKRKFRIQRQRQSEGVSES